jgi:mRNA-degrading endonuclease RelE of RelBE toxin-antitoxin system
MHAVIETPDFLADATTTGISDEERSKIVDALARNPNAGDEIPGIGGARKVRFRGRGKGKSGGYRVITSYTGEDVPLFLLNVFAK